MSTLSPFTLWAQKESFEEKALRGANWLDKKIDKTAEKIDLTLAGKKYTRRVNETNVKIRQLVSHSEGGKNRTSTDFGINLRLPNLERRWQVRFTSYDELEESRDMTQRRVRTQPRQRDYGAALMFFRRLGKVRTSFQPRLELKDPLEMSYLLRFESEADQKPYWLKPRFELFADPEKGTGEFLALEFRYEITDRWEFVSQNEEEYRERGNFFQTSHGLSVDYAIDDSKSVGQAVIFVSTNRPTFHLETFTVAPAFAHEIYRDRLRYIFTPFLTFVKAKHFKGDAGVSLNTELTF